MPKGKEASLFGIFQPTLLISESSGSNPAHHATQRMTKVLMHHHLESYQKPAAAASNSCLTKFVDDRLGELIVRFFKARRWRGHRKGYGLSRRLPQLVQPWRCRLSP